MKFLFDKIIVIGAYLKKNMPFFLAKLLGFYNKSINICKLLLKKKAARAMLIIAGLIALYKIVLYFSLLVFPIPESLTRDYSETFYYDDNSVAWIGLNKNEQYRSFAGIKEISSYTKKLVLEYEDKYFYFHPGINPISIIRAIVLNSKSSRIVSGASTITMQLARLAEPKERNIKNKLLEMFRALQIENLYNKNKILELYLNTIPMGSNIQGVKSASFFYFNKKCSELTFLESCLLIGISNSPEQFRPDRDKSAAKIQRDKVAERTAEKFNIASGELKKFLDKDVILEKQGFNYDIVPLVERFRFFPKAKARYLAIDKKLQELCLRLLKEKLFELNCKNGALVVVDNRSMMVKAYIGSPFYGERQNGVKYNAANIPRSPGSTLKPFIYAKAMEEGVISQKSILYDFPIDFGGYKPKNFLNKFEGLIPADQALIQSLNIPAVYLSSKLKKNGLKSIFFKAGLRKSAREIEKDDLSVALGSFPMTLENMVELYAGLANRGKYNNLAFLTDDKVDIKNGSRILSEESTFIIAEILSEVYRPDLPASWEFTKDKPRVAFKTGTSYGFVDAWSIGYTPRYTIGVWIGKLDNKFTKALTGIYAAAPVLFKIINELERKNDEWFARPDGVKKRGICSLSGMRPGKFCENVQEEYYIPKFSDNSICNVHRRVFVDKNNKITLVEDLKPDEEYEEKIIAVWDEEVESYLRKYGKKGFGVDYDTFSQYSDTGKIKISSPQSGIKIIIDLNQDVNKQKIALSAYEYPDSEVFFWYANGEFIGKVDSVEKLYYMPNDRAIKFSVIDVKGRSGEAEIKVDYLR